MDSSLSSSSPEPTFSGLKSVFNKLENITKDFEVSSNESVTAVPNNKSDLYLDVSSAATKELPFKKSRKSTQQDFNVSSDDRGDSVSNNLSEQSVSFAKPQPFLSKKRKSLIDFFNVSYNETNGSVQQDDTGKSIDESNTFSKNPFKKNEFHNDLLVRDESSTQDVTENVAVGEEVGMEESQRSDSTCGLEDEADSTTFVTKQKPFVRRAKQESSIQMEISVSEENETTEGENRTMAYSKENEEPDPDTVTEPNLSKCKESFLSNNSITLTKERRNVSTEENAILADPNPISKNLSPDRSVSKLTNKSTSYLEQSSINDENLNNWMSDQSDEEMPPPRIPSLTANLSHTKEKPEVPDSPNLEANQLSVWEQKLNEIISNADRKSKTAKAKIASPQKPKPSKKSDANIEKPVESVNKYKPPKLIKPAPFITKRMYGYIIKKLEPKYGIDTMLESENLVMSICDTVKRVTRRKTHQKKLIQNLKKEMAKAGLIQTTVDFHEFIIKFLPYSFRVKVVPCVQPVTNVVYPPKDGLNPFDKIL